MWICRHIQEQVAFAIACGQAFINTVVFRVNHQNFTAAVGRVNTIGGRRVDNPGHPFPGIFDAGFQGHGFGIHHPNQAGICHPADKQQSVVPQDFTRANRVAVRAFFAKFHPLQNLAGFGIPFRYGTIKGVGGVEDASVRLARHAKVFIIGMRFTGSGKGCRIQTIKHATINIFKTLRAGDIKRLFRRRVIHLIESIR